MKTKSSVKPPPSGNRGSPVADMRCTGLVRPPSPTCGPSAPSVYPRPKTRPVRASAAAAALARTGRVFDLGYTLGADGPQVGLGGRTNPVHLMSATGEPRFPDGGGFTDDFVFMPLQCATQWDGLAHVFYD